MKNYVAKDVDEYIFSAPKEAHAILNEMRALIKSAVPKAEESISWGIPFYKYHGMLSWFSVFKEHISFGLGWPNLEDEVRDMLEKKGYKTGKKIIQIKFDQKIPTTVIKQILKEQAQINENKEAKKAMKK